MKPKTHLGSIGHINYGSTMETKEQQHQRELNKLVSMFQCADCEYNIEQLDHELKRLGYSNLRDIILANLSNLGCRKIAKRINANDLRRLETPDQLKKRTWKQRINKFIKS